MTKEYQKLINKCAREARDILRGSKVRDDDVNPPARSPGKRP